MKNISIDYNNFNIDELGYSPKLSYLQTYLHTIRLTGKSMDRISGVQMFLHELIDQYSTEKDLKKTTWYFDTFIKDSPLKLSRNLRENHSPIQLKESLICPKFNFENFKLIRKSLFQYFAYYYHYKEFSFDDLHLLMKISGYLGYLVTTESQEYLILLEPDNYLTL